MSRVNHIEQIINFIVFIGLQLLLHHRVVLFDIAFAQIYVGFLLFLPRFLAKPYQLIVAFIIGILVDSFGNTLGMHAITSLLIVFVKDFWLKRIDDESTEWPGISIRYFSTIGFLLYIFPLIFIHHFVLFTLENGGMHLIRSLFLKVILSSLFTVILITIIEYLVSSKKRV